MSKPRNRGGNGNGAGAQSPAPKSITVTRQALEKRGIRIVIGFPMDRVVMDQEFMSHSAIIRHGWPIIQHLHARTDINRNKMGDALLASNYTHLCMLDLDHYHDENIVERLALHVLADPKKLVVGGFHFRRSEPFEPCAFFRKEDGNYYAPAEWKDGIGKVDIMGHGSILIHRSVLEQLPKPWWMYTYPQESIEKGVYPSEDIWFCQLCNKHGIALWCDTTITSPHLVPTGVDADTFRQYLAAHPERVTQPPSLAGPVKGNGEAEQISKSVRIPEMVTRVEA